MRQRTEEIVYGVLQSACSRPLIPYGHVGRHPGAAPPV